MFKFVNKKNRTVAAFLLVCCITVSMLYSTPAYALEVTQTDVKCIRHQVHLCMPHLI